jgi:hypothetical protein
MPQRTNQERRDLRALLEQRRSGLEAFARWEAEHPAERELTQVFASLGALYELLPVEHRRRDEDPKREGVRLMHERLAGLS